MNSDVKPSIIQMEQEQLNQLLTQVPETVASATKHETFIAANLWSIHRSKKPALRNKLTERWKM
ncbi:MAG: hypothetical protein ACOVNY_09965 [Chitinophagaceae bacterium]